MPHNYPSITSFSPTQPPVPPPHYLVWAVYVLQRAIFIPLHTCAMLCAWFKSVYKLEGQLHVTTHLHMVVRICLAQSDSLASPPASTFIQTHNQLHSFTCQAEWGVEQFTVSTIQIFTHTHPVLSRENQTSVQITHCGKTIYFNSWVPFLNITLLTSYPSQWSLISLYQHLNRVTGPGRADWSIWHEVFGWEPDVAHHLSSQRT